MPLDEDYCRKCGYWLADGGVCAICKRKAQA